MFCPSAMDSLCECFVVKGTDRLADRFVQLRCDMQSCRQVFESVTLLPPQPPQAGEWPWTQSQDVSSTPSPGTTPPSPGTTPPSPSSTFPTTQRLCSSAQDSVSLTPSHSIPTSGDADSQGSKGHTELSLSLSCTETHPSPPCPSLSHTHT